MASSSILFGLAAVLLHVGVQTHAGFVPPAPKNFTFTQKLDHMNPNDTRTFEQLYLVYDGYWNGKGPVFFCPGGESSVYAGYNHNGLMFEFGKEVHALLVFPEHRYYGATLPFGPTDSYLPENIQYLTIEQALEDYVATLDFIRAVYSVPKHSPVLLFGGSYPGELAAFLRFKYPKQFDGALASSAPVRYHQGLTPAVPSGAFFEAVTKVFGSKNKNCPDLVQQAVNRLHVLAVNGRANLTLAGEELRLCTPMTDADESLDLTNLWIENAFALLAMENYPYATGGFPANPLQAACDSMLAEDGNKTVLMKLADAVGVAYNMTKDIPCYDISKEYYKCADITGCGGGDTDPNALSWDYQSCTEIVSNVDTNGKTDMFTAAPYDFNAVAAYCLKKWGTTPQPLKIPMEFDIKKHNGSRIIFSNGEIDPWFPGGIHSSPAFLEGLISINIPKAAHHLDLRGSDSADPEAVRIARLEERSILRMWLFEAELERAARS